MTKIIPDTRVITTKEQFAELLNVLNERFPYVMSTGNDERIVKERKEAEAACYTDIERRLEMLGMFSGIVADMTGETHDSRQAARGERARIARDFLVAFDHSMRGRNGPAPGSTFDPRLMRVICNSVKAHDAFENSRNDILAHLPAAPAPETTPAPTEAPAAEE